MEHAIQAWCNLTERDPGLSDVRSWVWCSGVVVWGIDLTQTPTATYKHLEDYTAQHSSSWEPEIGSEFQTTSIWSSFGQPLFLCRLLNNHLETLDISPGTQLRSRKDWVWLPLVLSKGRQSYLSFCWFSNTHAEARQITPWVRPIYSFAMVSDIVTSSLDAGPRESILFDNLVIGGSRTQVTSELSLRFSSRRRQFFTHVNLDNFGLRCLA